MDRGAEYTRAMFLVFTLLPACSPDAADAGAPTCDTAAAALSVTWDNWAEGFFVSYCQACHASDTPNANGAPAGVHFDTVAEARALAERIRARVLDDQTMPPAGGVLADDLRLLDAWLACDVSR